MNGMIDITAAAVHRAVLHGRGLPVPIHSGGTPSAGGLALVVVVLAAALAIAVIGWRLDRRGTGAQAGAVRIADETDTRRQPRKPAAAPPLTRGEVGVVQRRQSPERRDDRSGLV